MKRSSLGLLLIIITSASAEDAALQRWLKRQQNWRRDTNAPILSLGPSGAFDDTHIFAPCVSREDDAFQLLYCGSTGRVAQRVFHVGRAVSRDGRKFERDQQNPVFKFGDGKHSILTPTLLRAPNGETLREDGKLRMWFSSTWFEGGGGVHTLHESHSENGVTWDRPSPKQLTGIYSPSVLKIGDRYRMWFVDVSVESWIVRHAESRDGKNWRVTGRPCLKVDQAWERSRLFYPTVLQKDGVYLMWYGSYWSARGNTTAIGFAVSKDGLEWRKHNQNPVLTPDPKRAWESHYVTSQSIMFLDDGSLRIWYASRRKPPFVNKYFALNTAVWKIDRSE